MKDKEISVDRAGVFAAVFKQVEPAGFGPAVTGIGAAVVEHVLAVDAAELPQR